MSEIVERNWYVVDASNEVLGRLASRVSLLLQGKHKPEYVPYEDRGDYVIVTNIEKIKVTGNKMEQKIYYSHSQYPGGLKEVPLKRMMEKDPRKVFWLAVKNMLPKNKLAKKMLKKLKIYVGEEHRHHNHKPMSFQTSRAR